MARLENSEIAALFTEMADLLQIDGGDRHRVAAFRRAARVIEALPRPAEDMIAHGDLQKIRGVGAGTIRRTKQMLRTHTCDDLDKLRRRVNAGLREMLKIKGLGPTTVRNIYQRLGVETVDQLEYAAKTGAIEAMPRMGPAMVHKLLAGIEAYRRSRGKIALIESLRVGRRIAGQLAELPEATRIELAGSVRRGKALIGDLDILVATTEPAAITARFTTLADVQEILMHGEGRCSVRLSNRQQCDLRLLPPQSFGAGLHYFTGSKAHNIELRKRANRRGLKISDKGLFRRGGDEPLIDPCVEERDVFARLGLPWIAPELRENLGEFEAAERGRLPRLIEQEDLRGDLHMHTTASDGRGSVAEMAERARELGHHYIAITEHSKSLKIANGLDEQRLAAQLAEIRAFNEGFEDVQVLAGIEVDILADGALDLDPALLAQLDWVIASVHQWTRQDQDTMTARVVRAIESGVVDCIGHPTGRRPGKRDPYAVDIERVMVAARDHEVALECNGGPNRMDLGDLHCRRCRERGVLVSIATDAHAPRHLGRHEFGLAMARRGWLQPSDILNTRPWGEIAERRARRLRDQGDPSWGASPVLAQVPLGVVLEPFDDDDDDDDEIGPDAHAWIDVDPLDELPAEDESGVEAPESPGEQELPEPDETLVEQLTRAREHEQPLEEALRERLQSWLMATESDPQLEAALRQLGDNPLQLGFDLLSPDP